MSPKKKRDAVVVVCVQEQLEDGSKMDLGAIQGEDLKFLHQAFISDTISNALAVQEVDIRLYSVDKPERSRFVGIINDYLSNRLTGKLAEAYRDRFKSFSVPAERWGVRIEGIFADCFKAGYRRVLVLGSRTPTVRTPMIVTALKVLQQSDSVFGPTPEGRYYVIGMSGGARIKLSEFDWKSPTIYNDVARAFDAHDLSWSELDIWYAVESPEDLEMMVRDINQYRFEGDETTARETELALERLLNKLET